MYWKIKTLSQLNYHDIYQLFKLRTDIFVVEQNCAYPEIDENDLECIHGLLFNHQEQLIACFRIIHQDQHHKIGRVAIHHDFRGQGLAYKVMAKAIEECQQFPHIKLSAQAHLKKFYNNCGFKECSEIYLEDGIPHLEMEKSNFNY